MKSQMQNFIPLCGLALLTTVFFTACSSHTLDEAVAEQEETAAAHFQVSRSVEAVDAGSSLMRMYVSARSLDHASASDGGLYSDPNLRSFPAADKFTIQNLKLQWYKFSLVMVPHRVGSDLGGWIDGHELFSDLRTGASDTEKHTRDFSGMLIDYTDVLSLQEKDHASSLKFDLHLYRAVVSRWMVRAKEGQPAPVQALKLKRITGQLELNMGILPDQFEHRVDSIVITANLPRRVYLSDSQLADEEGKVQVEAQSQVMRSYIYKVPQEFSSPDAQKPCKLTMALLPCRFNALVSVHCTNEKATDPAKKVVVEEYVMQNEGDLAPVQIKPNVRTTVLFNGMYRDDFEVRYAGFPGSGIDVDGEEWDGGWIEPKP